MAINGPFPSVPVVAPLALESKATSGQYDTFNCNNFKTLLGHLDSRGDGKVTGMWGNGYVRAYGNQIVATTNYGIAIAGGLAIEAYGNRIVSSGRLPDGRRIAAANVGMYVWDIYGASNLRPATFARHVLHDNVAGWTRVGPGRGAGPDP